MTYVPCSLRLAVSKLSLLPGHVLAQPPAEAPVSVRCGRALQLFVQEFPAKLAETFRVSNG